MLTLIAGIVFLPFIMWAERALKFRYLNPVEQSLQRAANGAALVIIPPLLLFGVFGADGISTRIRKFLDDNKEIQSIKRNIETDTAWMTGPMRHDMQVMGGTDFRALKDRCTTLYVILPTSEMVNKAPYLRLLLSTVLRHLYRYDGLPVTLLVDEAFVLGHLTELENVCSILRGYGSRLLTVFQSLQQIQKLYPDTWELFGLGAVLGFRPGDTETARRPSPSRWLTRQ